MDVRLSLGLHGHIHYSIKHTFESQPPPGESISKGAVALVYNGQDYLGYIEPWATFVPANAGPSGS